MRLLRVGRCRSIWLGRVADLDPRGKIIRQIFIPAAIERYKFMKSPELLRTADSRPGDFYEEGIFTNARGENIGVSLIIYNDGLVADATGNTQEADEFMDDFVVWASVSFHLAPHQEILKAKRYTSVVYVEMEKSLDMLNPKLAQCCNLLSSKLGPNNKAAFETTGISLGVDEGLNDRPNPFRLEREEGTSFSENRYFSVAPLQTQDHLDLLEEFEKILST